MFRFLCTRQRTLVSRRDFLLINSNAHLGFVQSIFFSARLLSSSSKTNQFEQKQSLMVSYLMNSCGLSLESAVSSSKNVGLKNVEKADSVLRLLRENGLNNAQISGVVSLFPKAILLDPERILLPKIEFFRSIGLTRSDLAQLISRRPSLLSVSLKNRLIPNYNFLKNVLVLDEKVVMALKRSIHLFSADVESILTPNIALLKEVGVPQSRIPYFVIRCPAAAVSRHSKFCNIVNEVKEMGFNPAQLSFISAIQVISQLKKSIWESKIEVYRRWGWSKDEILAAFRRHPQCMHLSVGKITRAMNFLVNKMGWLSQDIAKMPVLLALNLEKRISPRCSVIQVLQSKGLIKEDICPSSFLFPREEEFLKKYVTKFQEKVPQLLNVYQGKIDFLDVKPGFQKNTK